MNHFIKKQAGLILIFSIFSILMSAVEVAFAELMNQFINAIGSQNTRHIIQLIMFFALFVFTSAVMGMIVVFIKTKVLQNIRIEIKTRILANFLEMSTNHFSQISTGKKLNMFDYYLEVFEQYYLENLFSIIQGTVILLFASLYIIHISPLVFVTIMILSLAVPIFAGIAGRKIDKLTKANSVLKDNFIAELKEIFSGFNEIKAYAVEANFLKRFKNNLEKVESNTRKLSIQNSAFNQLLGSTQYITIIVCFCLGGWLVISKKINLGQLIAMSQISNMIIQPIQSLGTSFIEIKGSQTVRGEIETYLNAPSCQTLAEKKTKSIDSLELRDISYAYHDITIIDHISIKLLKGRRYAVVGASGSGKTTLLNLLSLSIEGFDGNIIVNGEQINSDIKNNALSIAYVRQSDFLFRDTIRANITLFDTYSEEAVIHAIGKAELSDSVEADQIFDESGHDLSGGQRQRICIARALIRQASLCIFDEFSSSLDVVTKKKINSHLLSETEKNNIMVFATHDLNPDFLRQMDCIYFLENGKICESGSFDELISKKGQFSYFLNEGERLEQAR